MHPGRDTEPSPAQGPSSPRGLAPWKMLLRSFWGMGGRDWMYVRAWGQQEGPEGAAHTLPPPTQRQPRGIRGAASDRPGQEGTQTRGAPALDVVAPAPYLALGARSSPRPWPRPRLPERRVYPPRPSCQGRLPCPPVSPRQGQALHRALFRWDPRFPRGCRAAPQHAQGPGSWGLRGLLTHVLRGDLGQHLRAGRAHHLHDPL